MILFSKTNKEIGGPCFTNKEIEAQRLMFELMSSWGGGRILIHTPGLTIETY